jgi:acyl-CoA reductase-like NAD-dependent aldehyde dehydrogenase
MQLTLGEEYLAPESRPVPLLLFQKKARVEYFPMGVIGIIIPGNYPFHNILSAVASTLFAGNAGVVKVSEVRHSPTPVLQLL